MFDNRCEFKQNFTPLIDYFDNKPVLTTLKNPLANDLGERVYKVITNMCVTKYLSNKVFDYIDSWC